jgi:hypothetical protein
MSTHPQRAARHPAEIPGPRTTSSLFLLQRNHQPDPQKARPGVSTYLALTFGTLLSSQGTDASFRTLSGSSGLSLRCSTSLSDPLRRLDTRCFSDPRWHGAACRDRHYVSAFPYPPPNPLEQKSFPVIRTQPNSTARTVATERRHAATCMSG